MKKAFSIIIVAFMLSISAFQVFAADDVAALLLSSDVSTLKAGETAKIVCSLDSTIYLAGFQFDITFDNTRLELTNFQFVKYTDANKGEFSAKNQDTETKALDYDKVNSDGFFRLMYLYSGTGIKKANMVTLTFKAKENCYKGNVVFGIKNVTVGNADAQKVTYSKLSATIDIEGLDVPVSSSVTSSETSSETSSDNSSGTDSSNTTSSNSSSSSTDSSSTNNGQGLSAIIAGDTKLTVEDGKNNYSVTVDDKTKSIDISGITKDENATVVVEGNEDLKEGDNDVKVTVTDEDGNTKEYNITVTKGHSSNLITYIIIGGAALLAIICAVVISLVFKKRKKAI